MKQKKKEPAQKQKAQKGSIVYPDKRLMYYAGCVAAFIVIARGIASFFPDARLWGLNYLAFLPIEYLIVLSVASLLFATPFFYRAYGSLARLFFGSENSNRVSGILLAVLAGWVFWFLRMQTYFLGDGASYLGEQYRFIKHASISINVLFGANSAPLTGTILAYVARAINDTAFLKALSYPGPLFTFWIFGVACGMVYIIGCLRAARSLFDSSEERFGAFILCLFTPGALFYFGYVEYYTFYFTCIFFYFFLAARAIDGKHSVLPPILILIVSCAFHLMSLIALPSLLFLLLSRSKNERLRSFTRLRHVALFIAGILIIAGIVYFASGVYVVGSRNIMALFPYLAGRRMQYYSLLSSYHLLDFPNFLFLISAPLWIGMAIISKDSFRSPAVLFASINLVFFTLLAFFGNTAFGMARDWDINAGLGLAAVFFVFALIRHTNKSPVRKYLFYLMSGAALTAGIGWFAANINTGASVEKFKAVLALDEKHMASDYVLAGYEHLRKYYLTTDDKEGCFWAINKKIELAGYPQDYREYSQFVIDGISQNRRRTSFDRMFSDFLSKVDSLERFSTDSPASLQRTTYMEVFLESYIDCYSLPERDGLGKAYAERWMDEFEKRFPHNVVIDFVRTHTNFIAVSPVRNVALFREVAGKVRSSAKLLTGIGIVMMMIDGYNDAALVFERAYTLDPSDAKPKVYLAAAEYQCYPRNTEKIRQALETYFRDPKYRDVGRLNADDRQVRNIAESLRKSVQALK